MSEPTNPDATRKADDDSSQLSELIFVSTTILRQALDLVDNKVLTDDNHLTAQSKYLPGSTIGSLFARIYQSLSNVDNASNRKTHPPCTGSLYPSDRLCSGKRTLRIVLRCTESQHAHGEQPLRSSERIDLHVITPQRVRIFPFRHVGSRNHFECCDALSSYFRNHIWQRGQDNDTACKAL